MGPLPRRLSLQYRALLTCASGLSEAYGKKTPQPLGIGASSIRFVNYLSRGYASDALCQKKALRQRCDRRAAV